MAKAFPILLLGGAAVMLMAGGKKRKGERAVAAGDFGEGTLWRIQRNPLTKQYFVEVNAEGKWISANRHGVVIGFDTVEEAKHLIERLDEADWTMDPSGHVEEE